MKNSTEFHHNTGEDGAATAEYAIATMVAIHECSRASALRTNMKMELWVIDSRISIRILGDKSRDQKWEK